MHAVRARIAQCARQRALILRFYAFCSISQRFKQFLLGFELGTYDRIFPDRVSYDIQKQVNKKLIENYIFK